MWEPDYVTVTDLADYCKVSGDGDDAELQRAVTAASRAVDDCAMRQFGLVDAPEARYYTAELDRADQVWEIEVDDLMTTVGLVVAYDSVGDGSYSDVITSYVLEPRNAVVKRRPWTSVVVRPASTVQPRGARDAVRVTARWGWTSVPVEVEQAVLLQGSRLFARRDSPYGVAGSPETGGELRLLARVDPDVAVSLRGVQRWWGAR